MPVNYKGVYKLDKYKSEICSKYIYGVSVIKLAKEYDCSENTIERLLHRNNIKLFNIKTGISNRKYSQATIRTQYSVHKSGNVYRGLMPLSKEDWLNIVFNPCYYCGDIDIKCCSRAKSKYTGDELLKYYVSMNGVDRKNNDIGYTVENSLPCCKMCNYMKQEYTHEEFICKIKKILTNLKIK